MKLENIAKTYNTLAKYIRTTNSYTKEKLLYKVKNKIYLINEKDRNYHCVIELDSHFLECMDIEIDTNMDTDTDTLQDNIIFAIQTSNTNKDTHFQIFDYMLEKIDKESLLENSFFEFCIKEIEKDNNITYSESAINSSIDTTMQEAKETESTRALQELQDTIANKQVLHYENKQQSYTEALQDQECTTIENKYIDTIESIIKESHITDIDTKTSLIFLKDDISKSTLLILSLHDEKEAQIEFDRRFNFYFAHIIKKYPQAYNGMAHNQVLIERLKQIIFETIKYEHTGLYAMQEVSNKPLHNTEYKHRLDIRANKKTPIAFNMQYIFLLQKQHKSFANYKPIKSFNNIIEKRAIKVIIAKERSPPQSRAEAAKSPPARPQPNVFQTGKAIL